MKGFLTYDILCDGECCGNSIQYTQHISSKPLITQAVRQAKREGWVVMQMEDKKCYCPDCAKQRNRKAERLAHSI